MSDNANPGELNPDGRDFRLLNSYFEQSQARTLRAGLFSDPAMPDDLAAMYEELAQQIGYPRTYRMMTACREFAESAYVDEPRFHSQEEAA